MPMLTTGAGKFPAIAGGGSPTFTFLGSEGKEFSNTTATFTTIDIGSASADRFIIVVIGRQNGVAVTGVTVAGVSLAQDTSQTPGRGIYIWSGLVTTGSGVQNVVVSTGSNDSFADCSIFCWSGTGMANTSGASATGGNANASSATISVTAGDFMVAGFPFACSNSGSTQAPTTARTATGTASGQVTQSFDWNTIVSTNASFSVGISNTQAIVIAAYR
jgi:hypothetical protein